MRQNQRIQFGFLVLLLCFLAAGLWFLIQNAQTNRALSGDGQYQENELMHAQRPLQDATEKKEKAARPEDPEPPQESTTRTRPETREGEQEERVELAPQDVPEGPQATRSLAWIAVNGLGQTPDPIPLQLTVSQGRATHVFEAKIQPTGKVDWLGQVVPKDAVFIGIACDEEGWHAELLGVKVGDFIPKKAVVRVRHEGRFTVRLVAEGGTPSELPFAVMLFPVKKTWEAEETKWIPEFKSKVAHNAETSLKCPPAVYEVVLAMEMAPYLTVVRGANNPFQLNIAEYGETLLELREPAWETEDKNVSVFRSDGQPQVLEGNDLSILLVTDEGGHAELIAGPSDAKPRLRVPAGVFWEDRSRQGEEMHKKLRKLRGDQNPRLTLQPRATMLPIMGGKSGHQVMLVDQRSIVLGKNPTHLQNVAFGPFAGDRTHTTVRTLTPRVGAELEPVENHLGMSTGVDEDFSTLDWLLIEATYQDDKDWLRARAVVSVHPGLRSFKLAQMIRPLTLELGDPQFSKTRAPLAMGLRWSIIADWGMLSRVHVDLKHKPEQRYGIPTFRHGPRRNSGRLSWAHDHKPGRLGIGSQRVNVSKLGTKASPSFRKIPVRCVYPSGGPAPFALVRAKVGNNTWLGTADAQGALDLHLMNTTRFLLDSGLTQSPAQYFQDPEKPFPREIVLKVPNQHSALLVSVKTEEDPTQLVARILPTAAPEEVPDHIPCGHGHLDPEGNITFHGLLPIEYDVEVFDPAKPKKKREAKVTINEFEPSNRVAFRWK